MRKITFLKSFLIGGLFLGATFGALAQGYMTSPLFSENFGTLADATAISTSNTAFSYVRIGTSTGTGANEIIAKNPGSFTGSSCLIGAKGTSISTVDKTGLTSFTSGVFTFKFKTPSSLTSAVLFSGVGTGATFGSGSGFSTAQLSVGIQVSGTSLQIRVGGSWTTIQTVAVSTSYTIAVVFNNTAGTLSYGDSKSLASNKCHIWVNGAFVSEYATTTASFAASAFRIYTTTSEFEVDDIAVYNSMPAATPTITAPNPTSLTGFSTVVGTASDAQTFTVDGANLVGDLVVTAPTDFEVRESGVGSYGASVAFTPATGTVASKTIDVRIKSDAATNSNLTGTLTITSTGATQKEVALSGAVGVATSLVDAKADNAVYATSGNVVVKGGSAFEVYNAVGQSIAKVQAGSDVNTLSLRPGIYVVKTAGKTAKVVVR